MSEEEIIGKLKLWMECASINNGNSCIVNKAELQGLLDLYDKEKEKIKEINEEYNAEQKHEMENTIPKSKVEAKIEQLDYNDIGNFERRCKREVLQELLGKE